MKKIIEPSTLTGSKSLLTMKHPSVVKHNIYQLDLTINSELGEIARGIGVVINDSDDDDCDKISLEPAGAKAEPANLLSSV